MVLLIIACTMLHSDTSTLTHVKRALVHQFLTRWKIDFLLAAACLLAATACAAVAARPVLSAECVFLPTFNNDPEVICRKH